MCAAHVMIPLHNGSEDSESGDSIEGQGLMESQLIPGNTHAGKHLKGDKPCSNSQKERYMDYEAAVNAPVLNVRCK
ncbi:unnamed protein product, partial [Darwinula stevensoni]